MRHSFFTSVFVGISVIAGGISACTGDEHFPVSKREVGFASEPIQIDVFPVGVLNNVKRAENLAAGGLTTYNVPDISSVKAEEDVKAAGKPRKALIEPVYPSPEWNKRSPSKTWQILPKCDLTCTNVYYSVRKFSLLSLFVVCFSLLAHFCRLLYSTLPPFFCMLS